MTQQELILAANKAQLAGFTELAAALVAIIKKQQNQK